MKIFKFPKYDEEIEPMPMKKTAGFIYQENAYKKNFLKDGKKELKILKEEVTKTFIISDFSKYIKLYQEKGIFVYENRNGKKQ